MKVQIMDWLFRHSALKTSVEQVSAAEEHQRQVREEQEQLEEELRMVRLRKERDVWRGQ